MEAPDSRQRECLQDWLEQLACSARLVDKMSESLCLLSTKRSTLEEKFISKHLHQLAGSYGQLISLTNAHMLSQPERLTEELLKRLKDLNNLIDETVSELLKVCRYNFNFLEQYFEYDFVKRLTSDFNFHQDLETIVEELKQG